MRTTLQETLEKTGVMVIDGSMSTALEQLGCDLNDSLWTAKALDQQPELVRQVHENYFAAGADCGITCSYQATIPGLMAKGHTLAEAENLITRSVELFREARERWWQRSGRADGRAWPLCLGAVGPYGAYLADGSEYRGNYGVSEDVLRDFHRRRMELLWQAGADLLLIETQPSLAEAKVELSIAEELGAEAWVSFSCRDGSPYPRRRFDPGVCGGAGADLSAPADGGRQLHAAPVCGASDRSAQGGLQPAGGGLSQQRRDL